MFRSFTIAFKSTFGSAFNASSFVILPPLPLPETDEIGIFFSIKIFEAAGDGVPLTKLFSKVISLDSSTVLMTLTGFSSCFTFFISGALAEVLIKQTT